MILRTKSSIRRHLHILFRPDHGMGLSTMSTINFIVIVVKIIRLMRSPLQIQMVKMLQSPLKTLQKGASPWIAQVNIFSRST